jgi:hypothetical protein
VSIAERLRRMVEQELDELDTELARAAGGRDRSVHKARKTLQRLRAVAMLLPDGRQELRHVENTRMAALRRRLGPLRDAASRAETFRLLARRRRWSSWRRELRQLAARQAAAHAEVWARTGRDSAFWQRVRRESAALRERAKAWPFDAIDADALAHALAKAERRLHRSIEAALHEHGRQLRHELRRKLRRYANLRRLAAECRDEYDGEVASLLSLAQRCGHEGDLWLAVAAARGAARLEPALKELALHLERQRRRLCARHDAALARLAAHIDA